MFAAAPAGGAELGQIAIVVGFVSVAYAGLIAFALAHRAGRPTRIGALAERLAARQDVPAWAALPLAVAGVSLATVYLGLMWDMSLHIDRGRDPGPLANPAHYLILLGLYGIFAAGFLALALAESGRRPLGGVLLTAAGTFALAGFPLDDVWHRLFGQDVTLWGPTHLIMLGGGVLSVVGGALLLAEACRQGISRDRGGLGAGSRLRSTRILTCAAMLVGLAAFLGEFGFGVPQFRLVLQPALIAFACGVALVCARRWAGPGAALGASVLALGMALLTAVTVRIAGEAMPLMPLFVPAGIAVELASATRRGPVTAGASAATLGLAGEWAWTHVAMPIAWTPSLLPEAAVMAVAAGVAGALIGAQLGSALRREPPSRAIAAGALAAFALVLANGLVERTPRGAQATIARSSTGMTVTVSPAKLADDAASVRYVAWQGGPPRREGTLERVAPGVYRTRDRVPVTGDWKSLVLIDSGRALVAAPVYEPADAAIPVGEVPARPQVTRPLEKARDLLQRERKAGVPTWLWTSASLVVLALGLGFLTLLGWGVERFATDSSSTARTSPRPNRPRCAARPSTRSPAGT
jgi:hypothetical protein